MLQFWWHRYDCRIHHEVYKKFLGLRAARKNVFSMNIFFCFYQDQYGKHHWYFVNLIQRGKTKLKIEIKAIELMSYGITSGNDCSHTISF